LKQTLKGPKPCKKREKTAQVQENKSKQPRAYTGRRSRMHVPTKR